MARTSSPKLEQILLRRPWSANYLQALSGQSPGSQLYVGANVQEEVACVVLSASTTNLP